MEVPAGRAAGSFIEHPTTWALPYLIAAIDAFALLTPALLIGARGGTLGFALGALLVLRGTPGERALVARFSRDLPHLLLRTGAVLFGAALIALLSGATWLPATTICAGSVLIGRFLAYGLIARGRAAGLVTDTAVIAGTGREAVALARTLEAHPRFGVLLVGFVGHEDADGLPRPIVGVPSELEEVVRTLKVSLVIIAPSDPPDPRIASLVRAAPELPAHTYLLPSTVDRPLFARARETDELWGFPLVRVPSALDVRRWLRAKRIFDLALGSLLVTLASPLMAATALVVRLSSPGPVLIRQKRVGLHGRVFQMLKFRTMEVNADGDVTWSVRHDPRTTPVGRVLRRLCLDELPQLINVLRGDMSLVGPRPERPYFADRFCATIDGYEGRLRTPPGLTGWAQIHGLRGDTSIADRSALDNAYIERWSIWEDVAILLMTLGSVVRPAHDPPPSGRTEADEG
jgi:exopolysaccharide biosynthesis polyprenyl glycosylphosphotransferase